MEYEFCIIFDVHLTKSKIVIKIFIDLIGRDSPTTEWAPCENDTISCPVQCSVGCQVDSESRGVICLITYFEI